MEPQERKLHTLMQRVSTIRNDKAAKRKETQKQRRYEIYLEMWHKFSVPMPKL